MPLHQANSNSYQQLAAAGSSGTAADFNMKDAAGMACQTGDAPGLQPGLHISDHIWGSHDFRVGRCTNGHPTVHIPCYDLHHEREV